LKRKFFSLPDAVELAMTEGESNMPDFDGSSSIPVARGELTQKIEIQVGG
jgi:hypothetical protein